MIETDRTRHRRLRKQGSLDRGDLDAILAAGFVCHLGVVVDGYPMVVPTVYGVAPGGDVVYFHGSVASRSLVASPQATVCLTITHVDGLVLARSVFEHGVNYRSAMSYGTRRLVTDPQEKLTGLRHLIQGLTKIAVVLVRTAVDHTSSVRSTGLGIVATNNSTSGSADTATTSWTNTPPVSHRIETVNRSHLPPPPRYSIDRSGW